MKFYSHSCAGVIISEHWVLTAAVCLSKNPEDTEVFEVSTVGVTSGVYHHVDKVVVHPNFKPIPLRPVNNIALLHVKKSIFGNETNLSAIPLGRIPDENGIRVQTVGWSSKGDLGIFNRLRNKFEIELRKLSLQTMDSGHCSKKHNKSVDNEICVSAGSEMWCTIDAGNPLITMKKRRLVGIGNLFRYYCNNEDEPELFIRLSVYIDWLRKVTGLDLPLD